MRGSSAVTMLDRLRARRHPDVQCGAVSDVSRAVTSTATSTPPPRLPHDLAHALEQDGHVFVTSYAGAAPLLEASRAHDKEPREVARGAMLFDRYMCPRTARDEYSGIVVAAALAQLEEAPWIRQVVSVLNPPSCSGAPSATADGGERDNHVDDESVGSSPPWCVELVAEPITTITAVLRHQALVPFLSATAAVRAEDGREVGGEEKEREQETPQPSAGDVEALWQRHLHAVHQRERQLLAALAEVLRELAAEPSACSPAPTRTLRVPIYHATVFATDTASTRIATVGLLTNRLLALMTRCSSPSANEDAEPSAEVRVSRLLRLNTTVVRALVLVDRVRTHVRQHDACLLDKVCEAIRGWAAALLTHLTAEEVNDGMLRELGQLAWPAEELEKALSSALGITVRGPSVPVDGLRRPPGALVHCLQGVSRSPSVVVFYLASRLREIISVASAEKAALEETVPFSDVMALVRRARPCVKPNICFAIELATLWRHLPDA